MQTASQEAPATTGSSAGPKASTVFDGAGNDVLDAGTGVDTPRLLGRDGSAHCDGLVLRPPPRTPAAPECDALVAFENLVGGTGADTLGGDENANVISGNAGADTIAGRRSK